MTAGLHSISFSEVYPINWRLSERGLKQYIAGGMEKVPMCDAHLFDCWLDKMKIDITLFWFYTALKDESVLSIFFKSKKCRLTGKESKDQFQPDTPTTQYNRRIHKVEVDHMRQSWLFWTPTAWVYSSTPRPRSPS